MAKLLVLHGPNLNLLGKREPEHYGAVDLSAINTRLRSQAHEAGHELDCFQSNAEHALIERIHAAAEASVAFIVFNPAAYTHTSVAIRDALAMLDVPVIEIHLSNIHQREPFRHQSMVADIAAARIAGFGSHGYLLALEGLVNKIGVNIYAEGIRE